MSERKKDSAGKTIGKRLDNPAPGQSARTPEGLRVVVSSRSGAAAVPQEVSADQQLQIFESAMKLFHARKFREARELFLYLSRRRPGYIQFVDEFAGLTERQPLWRGATLMFAFLGYCTVGLASYPLVKAAWRLVGVRVLPGGHPRMSNGSD